jgi:hypothetical protein
MSNLNQKPVVQSFSPAQLRQAGVGVELALWYHTKASKLKRLNLLDRLRIEKVNSTVRAAA